MLFSGGFGFFFRDGPAAAESLVEADDGKEFVTDGVGVVDLGVEVAALGIEDIHVADVAVLVLEEGELHVFAGSVLQVAQKGYFLACGVVGGDGVIDLLEDFEDFLLVLVSLLVVGFYGGLVAGLVLGSCRKRKGAKSGSGQDTSRAL